MENKNDQLNKLKNKEAGESGGAGNSPTAQRVQADDVSKKYEDTTGEDGLTPKKNTGESKKMGHDMQPGEENASLTSGDPLDIENNDSSEADRK